MSGRRFGFPFQVVLLACALLFGLAPAVFAADVDAPSSTDAALRAKVDRILDSRVTQGEREAAAARMKLQQSLTRLTSPNTESRAFASGSISAAAIAPPGPGGIPDYFGSTPNWAWTPPLRKFVDGLPGIGSANANNLGQYLTVAHPDTKTYPGSDYYEIELREYTEQLHSDLPATRLRGYVQVNRGTDGAGNNTINPEPIHYLGPTIFATKDRPVRVKFTNKLPIGAGGDLFLPVDTSVMGAGTGPTGALYKQNRATLHLHGGVTPWISDGTPHQWITPAGENTPYPRGVSVKNVPDMPDPGPGSMTFFYSNQQSARLLWIHDHSFGITRLNVYAGEAQAYVLTDDTEKKLVNDGIIPAEQIPLIIQDKTFVDSATIGQTDPTWNWGTTKPIPHTGDLWVPHVYVPAQNPADAGGMNATGRWHYGPWFWPPVTNIQFPPIANPYYDPTNAPWEPALMPSTPNPSQGMENYNDTPMVNGTAYPVLDVQPKSYRFRILNAANDRFFNLQMYIADPTTVSSDGRRRTEVKMIPAATTPGAPELWPTDGRVGGVPDFNTAGPEWVQIGTESGFLPAPAIIPQQPITWNTDPTTFNMGNVQDHSLLLGNAERADVIIDFSAYAGSTLILYNDAPTAFPALDQRTDYMTGGPDLRDTGGAAPTPIGYGPNTRTIMQIRVADVAPAQPYDRARLTAAFASTATTQGVFAKSQKPILVPDARYGSAYNVTTFTADPYVRIYQTQMTFRTLASRVVTIPLQPKAIQDEQGETFDPLYGRMSAKLGLEMPQTNATNANFLLFGFIDPPTEVIDDASMTPLSPVGLDGTQIWKITHNGVDTHPVHFHLFDVQLINRVGWDGAIRAPDDNELGWKDTIRISPLEDTIVALRADASKLPFGIPDSVRPLNPAEPIGSTMDFAPVGPDGLPVTTTNQMFNFGWEYVWHCHILSHEEMDMMRPVKVNVARALPSAPILSVTGTPGSAMTLNWVDPTPVAALSTLGNPANEIGFRIERAPVNGVYATIGTALANVTSYVDTSTVIGQTYAYRVIAFNAAGEVASGVLTLFQETNALIGYSGTWTSASGANFSGGSHKYASTAGAAFAVGFTGTSIEWRALTGPIYGIAEVEIDGVPQPDVDLYSASYRYNRVVLSKFSLSPGLHTMTVRWTGRKNAGASNSFISLDAVGLAGTIERPAYEDTHPLISYNGSWTTATGANYSGGSQKFANAAGAGFTAAFNGTAIEWRALTGPIYGIAEVEIDGVLQPDVNLYSSSYRYNQVVFTKSGLAAGPHTLTVRWSGRKSASSSNFFVSFDALRVTGTISVAMNVYEETNALLRYAGVWTPATGANFSGGSHRYANANDARVTAAFTGTSIEWRALKGPGYGIAVVQIDGVTQPDVDLYSPSYRYSQAVFTKSGLVAGPHTITISRSGRKNASSSGFLVSLDAFRIAGTLTAAP